MLSKRLIECRSRPNFKNARQKDTCRESDRHVLSCCQNVSTVYFVHAFLFCNILLQFLLRRHHQKAETSLSETKFSICFPYKCIICPYLSIPNQKMKIFKNLVLICARTQTVMHINVLTYQTLMMFWTFVEVTTSTD